MIRKSIVLTFAVLLMSAITAMACGNNTSQTGAQKSACNTVGKTAAKAQMIGDKAGCTAGRTSGTTQLINADSPSKVTMAGTLTCSSCSLKAEGAHAACSDHGCTTALKTADGRYISLMQNKFSKNLLSNKDMKNKSIQISGTYFANANMLDVQSYSVDGGAEHSWCGHCKGMDGCAAKTSGSL